MSEIKIDDDYIKTATTYLKQRYSDLQTGVDDYISIMNNILGTAIIEGETAEALQTYMTYVENLSDALLPLGEECDEIANYFLIAVDQADDVLY